MHQPKDYTQLQNDYYDKLAKGIKAQMTPRKESPRIHKQRLSKQRESIPQQMQSPEQNPDISVNKRRGKNERKNSPKAPDYAETSQTPDQPVNDDPKDLVDEQLNNIINDGRVDDRDPMLYIDVNTGKELGVQRITVYPGDTPEQLASDFITRHQLKPELKGKLMGLLEKQIKKREVAINNLSKLPMIEDWSVDQT